MEAESARKQKMGEWAGSPTGAEGVLQDTGAGQLVLLLNHDRHLQQHK